MTPFLISVLSLILGYILGKARAYGEVAKLAAFVQQHQEDLEEAEEWVAGQRENAEWQ